MMAWWAQLLVGLVVVAACMVGIILRLLHSMTPENHNWRTCRCEACSRKRYLTNLRQDAQDKRKRASRSEEDVQPPQPDQIRAHFISTAQLEEGMFVRLHENLYLVKQVYIRVDEYVIKLKNTKTRVDFEATVKFSRANQKMWEPAEWWRRS